VWLFVGVQFVPAEKVVAAFQHHGTTVYATASTLSEAQVYLEALEKGTDGIVLQTDDPREVLALMVNYAKPCA
jgi:3-dehydroquinate synthase class II